VKKALFSQKFSVTLDKATADMLRQYAAAAKRPCTTVAAAIVKDFLDARAEIGDGIPGGHDAKLKRTPILHELVNGLEARQGRVLESICEQLFDIQSNEEKLTVRIEKLASAFLLLLPETPENERKATIERGQRRLEAWLASVETEVEKRKQS
jgi:hypothetical protein